MKSEKNTEKAVDMLDILEKIFSNTNSWLKFAEAKNAAVIAFNIAVFAAVSGNASQSASQSGIVKWLYICELISVIISSLFALVSFVPKMRVSEGSGKKKNGGNLLLYKNIARYKKEQYLAELYEKYFLEKDKDQFTDLELDYAAEIITNAKIAVIKYRWFLGALILDICGLVILGILIFLV